MPYLHVLAFTHHFALKVHLRQPDSIQRWDCPNPVSNKQQESLDKWQEVKVKPQARVLGVQTTGLTGFFSVKGWGTTEILSSHLLNTSSFNSESHYY